MVADRSDMVACRDSLTLGEFLCKQTNERDSEFSERGRRWRWPCRKAFSCQTFLLLQSSLTQSRTVGGDGAECFRTHSEITFLSLPGEKKKKKKTHPSTTPLGKSALHAFFVIRIENPVIYKRKEKKNCACDYSVWVVVCGSYLLSSTFPLI